MDIDSILRESHKIAAEFGLRLGVVDLTHNAVSLRLYFDEDLFVQVYANQIKGKLNLNLVFKGRRLLGADSEGGRYHVHPSADPESHIFTEEKESMGSFMIKVLKALEERGLI